MLLPILALIFSSPSATITANRIVLPSQDTVYELTVKSNIKSPIITLIIGVDEISHQEDLLFQSNMKIYDKEGWQGEIEKIEESIYKDIYWQINTSNGIPFGASEGGFKVLVPKGAKTNLGSCLFTLLDAKNQRFCSKIFLETNPTNGTGHSGK